MINLFKLPSFQRTYYLSLLREQGATMKHYRRASDIKPWIRRRAISQHAKAQHLRILNQKREIDKKEKPS